MNTLIANVKEIKNVDNLHIIKYVFFTHTLTMMSLELPTDLKVGDRVQLGVKPTSVAIAKDFSGMVSLSNQIPSSIVNIDEGELLASITIKIEDVKLQSIITLESSKRMNLKIDDSVSIFIKASELSILKKVYD